MADERLFWCNSHQRKATASVNGKPHCDPRLGGILLPCRIVDLTDKVEIHEDDQDGV